MGTLKNENNEYSKGIIYHLEKLKADLFRIQILNNRNFVLSRSIDIMGNDINMIKTLVQTDPRFDWKIIQNEMDRALKKDTSLTGFTILFDFEKCKKPRRSLIPVTLIKSDNEK